MSFLYGFIRFMCNVIKVHVYTYVYLSIKANEKGVTVWCGIVSLNEIHSHIY